MYEKKSSPMPALLTTEVAKMRQASCQNTFHINDAESMVAFGEAFGKILLAEYSKQDSLKILLFYGSLGTGKTTFTRGFVSALPCSEMAEVASPSFTLCNLYPTRPPVLHCDLYRAGEKVLSSLPEDIEEALDTQEGFVLVEWAERLADAIKPELRLDIILEMCQKGRSVKLLPWGKAACRVVTAFKQKKMIL